MWIPALQSSQTNRVHSRVAAISPSGDSALRLTTTIWSRDTVLKVAQALATRARVVNIDQPVTVAIVNQIEPSALSWGERNPGKIIVISLLGTFLVLAGLFGIFLLTS